MVNMCDDFFREVMPGATSPLGIEMISNFFGNVFKVSKENQFYRKVYRKSLKENVCDAFF